MALMLDPFWATNQHTLVVATVVCVTGMTYLSGCTGPFFLKLTGYYCERNSCSIQRMREGMQSCKIMCRSTDIVALPRTRASNLAQFVSRTTTLHFPCALFAVLYRLALGTPS